jgi:hypothetical protein
MMQRTTISLKPEELDCLAHRADIEHVPQTEMVRRALHLYRQNTEARGIQSFEELAKFTSGIQQGEEGLITQQHLRNEWSGH